MSLSSTIDITTSQEEAKSRYIYLGVEPTPAEVDWAQTHLAHLETAIIFKDVDAHDWVADDGHTYRSSGVIVASPGVLNNRFAINLRRGATIADLEWLERVISEAKAGQFVGHGWIEQELRPGTYRFSWSRQLPSRQSKVDLDDVIYECTEPTCRDFGDFHQANTGEDFAHTAKQSNRDGVEIILERWDLGRYSEGTDWRVEIYATDCNVTAGQASGIASDIQWAAAECRRLNALREVR